MIKIHLQVKFRAFYITFKTVKRDWAYPLPFKVIPIPDIVSYHEHGIDLTVEIR